MGVIRFKPSSGGILTPQGILHPYTGRDGPIIQVPEVEGGGGGGPPPSGLITRFLANFEGTDGAVEYTSETGHTVATMTGGPISNAQAKFGATSAKSNGGNAATFANQTFFQSNDTVESWAVEGWFYGVISKGGTGAGRFYMYGSDSATIEITINSQSNVAVFYATDADGNPNIDETHNPTMGGDAWHHVCLEYDGASGFYSGYVDGVRLFRISSNSIGVGLEDPGAQGVVIGKDGKASAGLDIYSDSWRIVKGLPYNAPTYTVPTAAFSL